jgi:ubiquinone/menaquinone biosynthesis C-methylase UbiE
MSARGARRDDRRVKPRTHRVGVRRHAADSTRAWTAVAPAWEARVEEIERQSAAMTDAVLSHVPVAPGDRLLELAAGPGALGPLWSALVGAHGAVVVSDLSPAMVEAAAVRTSGLANVRTAVRDLCAIDEPDGSFDVVVCRMGLPFAGDPQLALGEVKRVLRPGGWFVVLTWGAPEANPWLTCVADAVASAGLLDDVARSQSAFSLSDGERLRSLVVAAGFDDVRTGEVPLRFRAANADEHFDRVASLAAPLVDALAGAPEDLLDRARRAAAACAAPYTTDVGVELPGLALIVSGRRPSATP